ncbi:5-oxoprolinase subunit C family protein [Herbiconiux liukaitaii]|uniref:5-oxoprolinase subunit C family protein n=1 Tax=Herbiconiux liukaitaii TaxID=3342799 RepID=UPI0035BB8A2E
MSETDATGGVPAFEVLATGPLALLQDRGRPGFAHLGVTASGAADRTSYAAANRLVGNRAGAAAIEAVFGGLELRVLCTALVAVTGAPTTVTVRRPSCDRFGMPSSAAEAHSGVFRTLSDHAFTVFAGDVVSLDPPEAGLRSYVAVRGGIAAQPVLDSRSSDVLSGLGPPPLAAGDLIVLGTDQAAAHASVSWPAADFARTAWGLDRPAIRPPATVLRILRGPRDDWFGDPGWSALLDTTWTTSTDSNRVGVRLDAVTRIDRLPQHGGELPSEGMVAGAVQVPPSGRPVVFLRDHPVTGGYPVIGVLTEASIDRAAQLRPGDPVRFVASDR